MNNVYMLPYDYILLQNLEGRTVWMVVCERTQRIVDAHTPSLMYYNYKQRLGAFLRAKFEIVERGKLTLPMIKTLNKNRIGGTHDKANG